VRTGGAVGGTLGAGFTAGVSAALAAMTVDREATAKTIPKSDRVFIRRFYADDRGSAPQTRYGGDHGGEPQEIGPRPAWFVKVPSPTRK
jgi:hypothetical protein